MFEASTVVALIAFAAWYFWNQRQEEHFRQIDWVVDAARLHRNLLEERGADLEAERLSERAMSLSVGVAVLRQKLPRHGSSNHEIAMAAKELSGDDWLGRFGVSPYSANYMPSKNALYWIAGKFEGNR
jgi:hypothetical protein